MYEVNDNDRTSYVTNYFSCHVQRDRLLNDAKRHLLDSCYTDCSIKLFFFKLKQHYVLIMHSD